MSIFLKSMRNLVTNVNTQEPTKMPEHVIWDCGCVRGDEWRPIKIQYNTKADSIVRNGWLFL